MIYNWEKAKQDWLQGLQNIHPLDYPLVIVGIIVLAYFVSGMVDWLGKL